MHRRFTPSRTNAQAPKGARLELQVYDGRTLVGVIRQTGKRHVAFGGTAHNRKRIGTFSTRRAAVRAIPSSTSQEEMTVPTSTGNDVVHGGPATSLRADGLSARE